MNIDISIEVLIPIILIFVLVFWFLWKKITQWRMKKKYNPDDDITKKGEEHRRRLIAEGKPDPLKAVGIGESDTTRPASVEGHGLLPTTTVEHPVKNRRSIRNLLRRRRK